MSLPTPTTTAVTVFTLAARTPGYYRLAYDATTKTVKGCLFATGETKTPWTLAPFETWADVQAFVAEQKLTGLTATDPMHR